MSVNISNLRNNDVFKRQKSVFGDGSVITYGTLRTVTVTVKQRISSVWNTLRAKGCKFKCEKYKISSKNKKIGKVFQLSVKA